MINTELSNPEIYYSPYGYIEINKNDFQDAEKEFIPFEKKHCRLRGTLKVNLKRI